MRKVALEAQMRKLAKQHGVECERAGGSKHDKWTFNGVTIMVPRHVEIGEMLARKILKDCHKALGE